MTVKPRLDRVREVANSTARVLSMTYMYRREEYKVDFGYAPELLWEPHQQFYFWVTPKPKAIGRARKSEGTKAAAAFEEWTGQESESEQDFQLPLAPLQRAGIAGRIVYRFMRHGDEYWHHDWDAEDSFYMGTNLRGPKVYAINGPKLQFTGRGIIN